MLNLLIKSVKWSVKPVAVSSIYRLLVKSANDRKSQLPKYYEQHVWCVRCKPVAIINGHISEYDHGHIDGKDIYSEISTM